MVVVICPCLLLLPRVFPVLVLVCLIIGGPSQSVVPPVTTKKDQTTVLGPSGPQHNSLVVWVCFVGGVGTFCSGGMVSGWFGVGVSAKTKGVHKPRGQYKIYVPKAQATKSTDISTPHVEAQRQLATAAPKHIPKYVFVTLI